MDDDGCEGGSREPSGRTAKSCSDEDGDDEGEQQQLVLGATDYPPLDLVSHDFLLAMMMDTSLSGTALIATPTHTPGSTRVTDTLPM